MWISRREEKWNSSNYSLVNVGGGEIIARPRDRLTSDIFRKLSWLQPFVSSTITLINNCQHCKIIQSEASHRNHWKLFTLKCSRIKNLKCTGSEVENYLNTKCFGNVFATAASRWTFLGDLFYIRWFKICLLLFMHIDALSLREVNLIKYVRKQRESSSLLKLFGWWEGLMRLREFYNSWHGWLSWQRDILSSSHIFEHWFVLLKGFSKKQKFTVVRERFCIIHDGNCAGTRIIPRMLENEKFRTA